VNFNGSFSGVKTLWKIIVHSENCHILGYFAAINGNSLPTFRDNLSIPFKCQERIGCTETSVRNYQYSLRNNAEESKILHFIDLHHAMLLGKRPTWPTNSFLCIYFLFITLYMFRAPRTHHQERQVVSIQPLVTVTLCWGTRHAHQHRVTVTRGCNDTTCLSWWWVRGARNM
jgi:dolichol kinase